MYYIKKPIVIEAMKFERSKYDELKAFCEDLMSVAIPRCQGGVMTGIINTYEGDMKVSEGDYIIKGVKGEFYPCKEDIFHETYAMVDPETLSYDL